MEYFTIYGNCQSRALADTLRKSNEFSDYYEHNPLKAVQTITKENISLAQNIFQNSDLLIHQIIKDGYAISELSTTELMKKRKKDSKSFTFPSLYFNAYFPHLDGFRGKKSILNLVHDFIIMYSYTKGLSEQQVLDLINNEYLYPKKTSINLLNSSLKRLKNREIGLDISISTFIENNYKKIKLFNQFNHPKGIVFDNIANQVFDLLSIKRIEESTLSRTHLDARIATPIYRSTYKNLELTFDENFTTYNTINGILQQDEVVTEFFKYYKNVDKEEMIQVIKLKKPFIINLFNKMGI